MKKLYFLFIASFTYFNLIAQQNSYSLSIENSCDCEIIIEQEDLDPSFPPDFDPIGTPSSIMGDLDSFVKVADGLCYTSVNVHKRIIVSNQANYERISMANNLNDLLRANRNYTSICLNGYFILKNTVIVENHKILKLLEGTIINYDGNGNSPAFIFKGRDSSIQGGEIKTDVPMNDGLIKISAEGTQNASSVQIKDITLTSNHDGQFGPNAGAKEDRAIHLSNNFESVVTQRDVTTNYHAQISNVDISGFAVGMHLRGWSNAAFIRDIRFSDISGYGLWVSGCVDNSFADLSFRQCNSAHAIRLDNYIDERYHGFQLGGQQISVADPNQRVELSTQMILSELLPNTSSLIPVTSSTINELEQSTFNANLDALDEITDDDNLITDPTLYFTILEACGNSAINDVNTFSNITQGIDILKFGLYGYFEDDENLLPFNNYPPDQLNVTRIPNLTLANDASSSISLFKSSFNHEKPPHNLVTVVPTCQESSGFTQFFRRPSYNIFTGVNVLLESENQVAAVVEIAGREDDVDLCMDNINSTDVCSNCFYEEQDRNGVIEQRNAMGFGNVIHVCELGGITTIVNNTATVAHPAACTLNDNILLVREQ